jgi:hypothetical protein
MIVHLRTVVLSYLEPQHPPRVTAGGLCTPVAQQAAVVLPACPVTGQLGHNAPSADWAPAPEPEPWSLEAAATLSAALLPVEASVTATVAMINMTATSMGAPTLIQLFNQVTSLVLVFEMIEIILGGECELIVKGSRVLGEIGRRTPIRPSVLQVQLRAARCIVGAQALPSSGRAVVKPCGP